MAQEPSYKSADDILSVMVTSAAEAGLTFLVSKPEPGVLEVTVQRGEVDTGAFLLEAYDPYMTVELSGPVDPEHGHRDVVLETAMFYDQPDRAREETSFLMRKMVEIGLSQHAAPRP